MVVEPFDAGLRHSRHLFEDSEIVQFAAQFAETLVDKIAARYGGKGSKPRPESDLSIRRVPRAACNCDSVDVAPREARAIHAEPDSGAWNSFGGARSRQFSFLDGGDDALLANDSRRRIVSHRREAENVHF